MNLIISLVHWSMHSIIESLCKLILINFSALLIDFLVKDSPVKKDFCCIPSSLELVQNFGKCSFEIYASLVILHAESQVSAELFALFYIIQILTWEANHTVV